MEIEFDPDKSAKNVEVRGLPFDLVADFDFDSALVARDTRDDYGEDPFYRLASLASACTPWPTRCAVTGCG